MCGFLVFPQSNAAAKAELMRSFELLKHRGPDDHHIFSNDKISFMFHRLAIMDLTNAGRQPFTSDAKNILVCNGEIYNFQTLKQQLSDVTFKSHSDCEVILPLYERFGIQKLVELLSGEYVFVLWDEKKQALLAARDPMGIRPMFYGKNKQGQMTFASEMKALINHCEEVKAFPPGHYFDGQKFVCYHDYGKVAVNTRLSMDEVLQGIQQKLIHAVCQRLNADAKVGYLLSGGLDSSLVCAIAQRNSAKPIATFSIGMEHDAIDAKYAKDVADFIGSQHTNVIMTLDQVLAALRQVIFHLETWDITTVRASIGMYLVCQYIHQKTPIKVLMTGEVSDELFGYKYTDFAPNAEAFQEEAVKRVRELYMYDVLRADRCIAAHSLEARVPFSDKDFVDFVMSIDPKLKMNTTGTGKFLLRKAFEHEKLLPEHILWREKAAFSDAVGHSMVDELKKFAEEKYSEKDLEQAKRQYPHCPPISKESLLYRNIFEEFYPGRATLIRDYWLPNQSWKNCNVKDPSARILPNYGKSGV